MNKTTVTTYDPAKMLRVQEVLKKTGIKRSTIYSMVAAGRFPKPIQLSARMGVWPEDVIDNWLAERINASQQ